MLPVNQKKRVAIIFTKLRKTLFKNKLWARLTLRSPALTPAPMHICDVCVVTWSTCFRKWWNYTRVVFNEWLCKLNLRPDVPIPLCRLSRIFKVAWKLNWTELRVISWYRMAPPLLRMMMACLAALPSGFSIPMLRLKMQNSSPIIGKGSDFPKLRRVENSGKGLVVVQFRWSSHESVEQVSTCQLHKTYGFNN